MTSNALNQYYFSQEEYGTPWELVRLPGLCLRGQPPRRDQPYITCVGASQTFGRNDLTPVTDPFPQIISEKTGKQVVNLGIGDASPGTFLNDVLLDVINGGDLCLLQTMSARTQPTEMWDTTPNEAGLICGKVVNTSGIEKEINDVWKQCLPAKQKANLLREQARQGWRIDYTLLLQEITVPIYLLWISQRPFDYVFRPWNNLHSFYGLFPHFVTGWMFNLIRNQTGGIVNCRDWKRKHPGYYPDQKTHQYIADKILDSGVL